MEWRNDSYIGLLSSEAYWSNTFEWLVTCYNVMLQDHGPAGTVRMISPAFQVACNISAKQQGCLRGHLAAQLEWCWMLGLTMPSGSGSHLEWFSEAFCVLAV